MNCKDYQSAIAADPSSTPEGGEAHVASCEACSAFRREMLALDARIAAALKIEVPPLDMPELPANGDSVVAFPVKDKPRFGMPAWIGIAAAFALAAVLSLQLIGRSPVGETTLAAQVLEHLDHEAGSRVVSNVSVSEDRLHSVVNGSVQAVDDEIGLITYARSCEINGRLIPHLVIQGEKGPVTLLLMPDEMIDEAIRLDGKGVNGVILPVGKGSIAIVGERDEQLEEIEKRVVDSVEWRI